MLRNQIEESHSLLRKQVEDHRSKSPVPKLNLDQLRECGGRVAFRPDENSSHNRPLAEFISPSPARAKQYENAPPQRSSSHTVPSDGPVTSGFDYEQMAGMISRIVREQFATHARPVEADAPRRDRSYDDDGAHNEDEYYEAPQGCQCYGFEDNGQTRTRETRHGNDPRPKILTAPQFPNVSQTAQWAAQMARSLVAVSPIRRQP